MREEVLGGSERPQGNAGEGLRLSLADRRELYAAAAQIDHDGIAELERRTGSQGAQARLFIDAQNRHIEARLLAQQLEQFLGVGGIAHGGGGDGEDPAGQLPPPDAQEAGHCLHRPSDRFRRQDTALSRAEARLRSCVEEHAIARTRHDAHEHEADRVRAEIDERCQLWAHEAQGYGGPRANFVTPA